MSVNCSAPGVFPPPFPSPVSTSNSSVKLFYSACQSLTGTKVIHTIYSLINIFLFPLYIFVLYVGFHRWVGHRSSPAMTAMTNTDFFTYNMMVVEVVGVLGSLLYTSGIYFSSETSLLLGGFFFCCMYPGQTLFHVLTCVDRYVVVVHPVAHMCLREVLRVRIRNVSTATVWLLIFGWVGIYDLYLPDFPTVPFLPFLAVCFLVILFCCLSVLRVLTQPGPQEAGGRKGAIDQSKQRAFHMILGILVTLLLRVVGLLVSFGLDKWVSVHAVELCVLLDAGVWLTFPSSLVLPLLFLKRAGRMCSYRKGSCFFT